MILLVIDMQKGLVDEDLYAFDTFLDCMPSILF